MKRLLLLFSLIIFLYSCQQTELVYSCDPVIDAFVTENTEELAQLTLQEIIVYELPLQRAIFASWSAEKKRGAWLEKFRYVLENEPLTEAEASHVEPLIEHLIPGYFEESRIQQEMDARYVFAENWADYASTELGWSKEYIGFISYRLYTSPCQMEAEVFGIDELSEVASSDSEYPCGCNTSDDYCQYTTCRSSDCKITTTGCGFLGMYSCNGYCS